MRCGGRSTTQTDSAAESTRQHMKCAITRSVTALVMVDLPVETACPSP